VTLELFGLTHPWVQVAERSDFSGATPWARLASDGRHTYELSEGDGVKELHVRFSDDGATPKGDALGSSIVLDTTAPTLITATLGDGARFSNARAARRCASRPRASSTPSPGSPTPR